MEWSQSFERSFQYFSDMRYPYFFNYSADGAHHLDLRPPNNAEPLQAVLCRSFVLSKLKEWIAAYRGNNKQKSSNIRTE